MVFVSELAGRVVADLSGERIGRLEDMIATLQSHIARPQIVAIMVKRSGESICISLADVAVFFAPAIPLNRLLQNIVPYKPGEHDLFLVRDVLDKQIIDTDGIRVVRVNDLEVARLNGHFYVINVDIGGMGLLRRLGLAKPAEKVVNKLGRKAPIGMVPWDSVELLPGNQPMRLKVPSNRITDLHPADLAEIISDLTRSESGKLLESLDVEMLADTLEEVEPEFQASLIEILSDEKAADVLEEMSPDEAADLLGELSDDRSEELLNLMEKEDAADVRMLLAFPEDSAGGIMTTEFITIPPDLTAEQAIARLRETADEAETIFYVYVTDHGDHLLGVFSLQTLLLSQSQKPVTEFMHSRIVSVSPHTSQDEVAQAISKYNLLAIPVVDTENRIQGIVTAADALDKIIPTAWKKRLPRMYR